MSQLDLLRSEAVALEAEASASGSPIRHSAALEQVAKRHGYESWRACRAILNADQSATCEVAFEFELKRYESSRWGFGIDIPQHWNAFPAVPTNSPYEVIRFASRERGNHLLIVFREPRDPEQSPEQHLALVRVRLEQGGFENFSTGQLKNGTAPAPTLDFDKVTSDGLWSCRHYVFSADTLRYVLGFGTSRWDGMLPLFDQIASSFVFRPVPWNQAE